MQPHSRPLCNLNLLLLLLLVPNQLRGLCVQKRLLAEFADAMEDVQKQQESRMAQGGAGALLARERRKALKDVLKVSLPTVAWSHRSNT